MTTPSNAWQAQQWANLTPPRAFWYSSSCGRIEIALTLDDARSGSHSGQCDDDVAALRTVPYIAEQLAALNPEHVRNDCRESGAWNDQEPADDEQNLNRVLWFACSDIRENNA